MRGKRNVNQKTGHSASARYDEEAKAVMLHCSCLQPWRRPTALSGQRQYGVFQTDGFDGSPRRVTHLSPCMLQPATKQSPSQCLTRFSLHLHCLTLIKIPIFHTLSTPSPTSFVSPHTQPSPLSMTFSTHDSCLSRACQPALPSRVNQAICLTRTRGPTPIPGP